jgi:hypothetical protein
MSLLANAVYANPTTPCWEPDTTGGGLNPTFDTVTFDATAPILSERVALGENVFSGASQVAIFNANANTLGPLQVGGVLEVQGGSSLPSNTLPRMLYGSTGVTFQQATTGTSFPIVAKNPDPATDFALTNIKTINGAPVPFAPAYGSFSSSITAGLIALTPLPLTYTDADVVPVGMTCALPSSDITITDAGVYKVLASIQCDNTAAGGTDDMEMWVAINGTPVPNSGTRVAINLNQETLMTVEWFLDITAGQNVSVVAYATVPGLQVLAVPAPLPTVPAIPSIITTVLRIA